MHTHTLPLRQRWLHQALAPAVRPCLALYPEVLVTCPCACVSSRPGDLRPSVPASPRLRVSVPLGEWGGLLGPDFLVFRIQVGPRGPYPPRLSKPLPACSGLCPAPLEGTDGCGLWAPAVALLCKTSRGFTEAGLLSGWGNGALL